MDVFEIERDFVESIHLNYHDRINDIKQLVGIEDVDNHKLDTIKDYTIYFMKNADKSDKNFIKWMYLIGCHIKVKFNGSWIFVHYEDDHMNRYVPAVLNDRNEIWQVGNFCYIYYYSKNRMNGISFNTFYKLEIERMIWKPKITDLNIAKNNFIYIENSIQ